MRKKTIGTTETTSIIILVSFACGGAFIQRTTGFGFGIFVMTMLPYLLPSYGECTTLSGMLASVTSIMMAIRYRKLIPWKKMLPILVTFIVVSFFAVQLLTSLRSDTLQYILGTSLILAALYFWFCADKIKVQPNFMTQTLLGILSGVMGGLFGMQGPPAVLYFLQITKTKEEYTAIAQTYFVIGNLIMTLFRANSGFLTPTVLTAWCWALPAVLIGTLIGNWAFSRLSMPLLRKLVYIYIAISGVLALIN